MSFAKEEFTVLPEHVLLLGGSFVSWQEDEFGAPGIDPKRPYGDSDVLASMREILGEGYSDERLRGLHRQCAKALEVFLHTGLLKAGTYTRKRYVGRWEPAQAC